MASNGSLAVCFFKRKKQYKAKPFPACWWAIYIICIYADQLRNKFENVQHSISFMYKQKSNRKLHNSYMVFGYFLIIIGWSILHFH